MLREHGLLHNRIGDGELLHAYTEILETGFYAALLERRTRTTTMGLQHPRPARRQAAG